MWSSAMFNHRHLFAFSLLLTLTSAEMCSSPLNPAVKIAGNFGLEVSMKAEYQGITTPYLIRWSREITDPRNSAVQEQPLVTYVNGNNSWADSGAPRIYAAVYRLENGLYSYELNILRATCESQGIYTCEFLANQDCAVQFNVSLTADPLAPVFKNETIYANPGTTVDVLCEANVGYPAGDIWWYYVPADGSNSRRITAGINNNMTSAGDCRGYMKSTLSITVRNEDQNAKIQCKTVGLNGQIRPDHISEGRVAIHGLEPTSPPRTTQCRGVPCDVNGMPTNGGTNIYVAASAAIVHVLVLFVAMFVI